MTPDPAATFDCDSLYVSPHGDDVLLSCAGRLLSELARGLRVTVITVFGGGDGARHAAAAAALDRLGVRRIALGLPEALTSASHPDDVGVTGVAAEALADLCHRSGAR